MRENVFLSTDGKFTSTEGNFLANMANELIQEARERLDNVKFYKVSVASISGGEKQLMTVGNTSIDFIKEDLNKIGEMNSFCAWVREAIKSKEELLKEINDMSIETWADNNEIELPKNPERPFPTSSPKEEDVLNSWDANKRNKYLRLEAFASTYGKYIHPKGALSNARKEAHTAINCPIYKEGSGRDLILYYQEPTIAIEQIDSEFMNLQSMYRSYEQELNSMKAELKEELNKRIIKHNKEYQDKLENFKVAYDNYTTKWDKLKANFNSWKTSESERISKLKIILPDNLMNIYSEIKNSSN